jgi:transposase InsO family protein
VWDENFQVYGVRKVWHQLRREGFEVARGTVERLMQEMALQGAVRGKVKRTTVSDNASQRSPASSMTRRPWTRDMLIGAGVTAPVGLPST